MYQAAGECSERRSHRDEMALVCVPVIADTGRRNRNRNIDSETRKVSRRYAFYYHRFDMT